MCGVSLNQQPSVTVIVCTRNRAASLQLCLENIAKLKYPNFTVLVVDNGSNDATPEVARKFDTDYIYVPQPGVSRARNAGVRHSSAEIVAYIDDDAVPDPAWLTELVECFSDPKVMAAAGHFQPFDVPELPQGMVRLVLDRSNPKWFAIAGFGGIGAGCNMAFRRSAFSVWQGFDERMGRGALIDEGEEHFGFLSLTAKGYRCVYTPRAVVYHGLKEEDHPVFSPESVVAYALVIFRELPECRTALLAHLVRSAFGGKRTWRQHRYARPELATGASTVTKFRALSGGIRMFLRACHQGQSREPLLVPSRETAK